MMPYNAEVARKVVERLYKMTAPQYRSDQITEDTEIYQDLGIYGDEIVDLVCWLEKEFGVTGNINPFKFARPEGVFVGLLQMIRKILGFGVHYESLKVRDILAVIDAKRWPAP